MEAAFSYDEANFWSVDPKNNTNYCQKDEPFTIARNSFRRIKRQYNFL